MWQISPNNSMVVFAMVLLVTNYSFIQNRQSHAFDSPDLPGTPVERAIMATEARYYELLDTPLGKLDIEQFVEILLDSEEYQLTEQRKTYLSQARKFTAVQSIGYLTAMQTKYLQMQQIEEQRKTIEGKAQAENRQVTDSEWEALAEANNGKAIPYIYHSALSHKTELSFQSVVIEENKAIVRYDDQAALQEAILTYVDGQWFIVDIQAIWVHF